MASRFWGKLGVINLYKCNPHKIRSKREIKKFMKQLCIEINMIVHGPCIVERFGEGSLEGISAMQLIETSSIAVHCDEIENRTFLDIFSCRDFDVKKAKEFSKKFFEASKATALEIIRK